MTFSVTELLGLNSPVEMYEFTRGVATWRYTTADSDQVYQSQTYEAIPMKRGKIIRSQVVDKVELVVTIPRHLALIESYINFPPGETMTLVIYSRHREDGDTVVRWRGRVMNVKWEGIRAEILCEPVYTSIRGQGLRRKYGPGCTHALYDQTLLTCKVLKESFLTLTDLDAVNDNVVNSADFALEVDGYFKGGFLFWLNGSGVTDQRMIVDHVGADCTLITPMPNLAIGDQVSVYPGCKHTLADCKDKFNNLVNYGGLPYSPNTTPFNTILY